MHQSGPRSSGLQTWGSNPSNNEKIKKQVLWPKSMRRRTNQRMTTLIRTIDGYVACRSWFVAYLVIQNQSEFFGKKRNSVAICQQAVRTCVNSVRRGTIIMVHYASVASVNVGMAARTMSSIHRTCINLVHL